MTGATTYRVAALVGICLLVGLPGAARSADWPGFLGPEGNGKSTEKILLDWPKAGPPVLWHAAAGEGYSAPTVADGKVFIFDRVEDQARLMAGNAATGEPIWTSSYDTAYKDMYRYSGGPRAAPVVDGGRVYAYGVDGRLRAHRVDDGGVLWDVDTFARYGVVQNFFGVGSAPVVEGDLLIVMVGGSPQGSPKISSGEVKPNGTALVAFDPATGEERWRSGDYLASYAAPFVATVGSSGSERRLGFAFLRGGLMAFEPTSGREEFFFPWRANKLESVNGATPVVVGDTVLLTESYGPGGVLLRVGEKGADPEVVWKDPRRDKSLECHWSTPIVHEGTIYASSGQSSGEAELRAVDHATGKVLWSEPGLGRSTLTYADGHLLVLTETGRLLLVKAEPEAYRKVAEVDLGTREEPTNESAKKRDVGKDGEVGKAARPVLRFPAWNAPVVSDGRLYLRGKDQVVVLDVSP